MEMRNKKIRNKKMRNKKMRNNKNEKMMKNSKMKLIDNNAIINNTLIYLKTKRTQNILTYQNYFKIKEKSQKNVEMIPKIKITFRKNKKSII